MSTIVESSVEAFGVECGKSFAAYLEWVPTKTPKGLTTKEQWGDATLGLIGEIDEMLSAAETADTLEDWMKIPDEVGDVMFYLAWVYSLAIQSGVPHEWLEMSDAFADWKHDESDADYSSAVILSYAAKLGECVKKHAFHGKDNVLDIIGYLNVIGIMVADIADAVCGAAHMPGGLGRIVERNVIKLEARYPSGFVLGGGIREEG